MKTVGSTFLLLWRWYSPIKILLANGSGEKCEILERNWQGMQRGEQMSLQPQAIPPMPEETARLARRTLPKGNTFINKRDELGTFFRDEDFLDLFSEKGQPAESPWRLALVMIMQYAEGLTDRQAVDAVRTRIDWKYALSLEITDAGFDFSILSEFRSRLLTNKAERRLFDVMLAQFREHGWAKERGKQRTDSTHVLAAIRSVNRLECVGETMRHAREYSRRSGT